MREAPFFNLYIHSPIFFNGDSRTGALVQSLQSFEEHLIYRTPYSDCFLNSGHRCGLPGLF